MNLLAEEASKFAGDLTATLAKVVECYPFRARAMEFRGVERFSVRQDPETGIPLKVDGEALLTLKVVYLCAWDTHDRYLAVEKSSFDVFAGAIASGEPLFRYDYVRNPASEIPGAHLQVHAHRDGITYVMSRAGRGSARGKRRARAGAGEVPRLCELHFALGGPRFRPCLEDVLEMLVCELGVDCLPEGRSALADGREEWRRQAIASECPRCSTSGRRCAGKPRVPSGVVTCYTERQF